MRAAALATCIGVLALGARSDEVRWINPTGGDWSNGANWSTGQVPEFNQEIIFDLDTGYVITVCGDRPLPWDQLRIEAGEVFFDLCGGSLLEDSPAPKTDWCSPRILVGANQGSDASVTFSNGTVFSSTDDCDYQNSIIVGSPGGGSAQVIIEEDADLGRARQVRVEGQSSLWLRSTAAVPHASLWYVGPESIMQFQCEVLMRNRGTIRVDGRLRVMEGLRNIEDSTIEGSGTVEVIGSSLVDLQIVRGVTLEFKGSVDVRVQYAEDAEFDFSASGESARFTVIGDDQRFLRSTFRFGANSLANPLLFRVKNDDAPAWGFDECSLELHLDSNPPIASSTMFVTMQTDLAVPPDPSELDFVVRTVEPVSSFIAIAPNSTGSWDLFVLGVPTGWHPADLTFDGRIDFFDIAAFIGLFTVQSPWANINGDYVIDFFDVADFIAAYLNG